MKRDKKNNARFFKCGKPTFEKGYVAVTLRCLKSFNFGAERLLDHRFYQIMGIDIAKRGE